MRAFEETGTGPIARLPSHSDYADPAEIAAVNHAAEYRGNAKVEDLAGMDAFMAKWEARMEAMERHTQPMRTTKTRKGSTASFRRGDAVRVRGQRHAFTVRATREGEVQVKRADGVGNARWYAVGRVSPAA